MSSRPLDLAAVMADDALLDALGGPDPSPEVSDARLAQVLIAWRHEVDTESIFALVDTTTALGVVARARGPQPQRRSVLAGFAAAVAVLVIAVGLGARAAEPGEALWPVTRVLYPEHARSTQAAAEVRTRLGQASDALAAGRVGAAESALERAQARLRAVDEQDGRGELEELLARVSEQARHQ